MVLICGYGAVAPTTLPHNGAIEYVIKPTLRDIKMLKRTKLLSKSSEICVATEYAEYIPKDYVAKMYVCTNIPQLLKHLAGDDKAQQLQTATKTATQDNGNTVTVKRQRRQAVRKTHIVRTDDIDTTSALQDIEQIAQVEARNKELINNIEQLNTINEELTEQIRQLGADNEQLNNTVQQLESDIQTCSDNAELLEAEVTELQQTVIKKDSAYADIEQCLKQTVAELNTYKKDTNTTALKEQIDDLTYTVSMLKGELDDYKTKEVELSEKLETERRQYEVDKEQYAAIIEQYEAESVENGIHTIYSNYIKGVDLGIPIEPQDTIDTTGVRVLCLANDNSNIYENIRNTITTGNLNAVVADFSGSRSLSARLKLPTDKGVQKLINGVTVNEIAVMRGKTQIVPSENMYDIQLLQIQWNGILEKLRNFAQGKPIYILLGNINSFSTRYATMLLSQKQPAYIISTADPDSVLNLYWQLATLNPARVKLVLTEYVPGTLKNLLDVVVTRYNTTFVKKGTPLHIETLN